METAVYFRVATPSGTFVEGDDITLVEVTTEIGRLGVMANHEPMVAACPPGLMRIRQGGEWITFRISRALLVVEPSGVKLLTPLARLALGR